MTINHEINILHVIFLCILSPQKNNSLDLQTFPTNNQQFSSKNPEISRLFFCAEESPETFRQMTFKGVHLKKNLA